MRAEPLLVRLARLQLLAAIRGILSWLGRSEKPHCRRAFDSSNRRIVCESTCTLAHALQRDVPSLDRVSADSNPWPSCTTESSSRQIRERFGARTWGRRAPNAPSIPSPFSQSLRQSPKPFVSRPPPPTAP